MEKLKAFRLVACAIICSLIMVSCGDDEPDNPFENNGWNTEEPAPNDTPATDSKPDKANMLELINKHVSVSASYSEYLWHFHIESTLHTALPGADIRYGIGHGDVDGITHISVENEAFGYSCRTENDREIMDFDNPFWFYWLFGLETTEKNKEICVLCDMYYASYRALKNKPQSEINEDEASLLKNIKKYLGEYENESDLWYHPSVQVKIDNKFYKIATYKRKK